MFVVREQPTLRDAGSIDFQVPKFFGVQVGVSIATLKINISNNQTTNLRNKSPPPSGLRNCVLVKIYILLPESNVTDI
jgi:hypothetical protein